MVLERGWLSSNSVVLLGDRSAAVVDTGYWTHSEQTLELLTRAIGPRPLATIVNTHLHSDHCGGNAALQMGHPHAQTWIPPGHAAAVRNWNEDALTYQATGQHCPPFHFDATLPVGGEVRLGDLQWQVHAAPGHDPHSVVLFEPTGRTLISADALWENGFGVVFQELEGEDAFDAVAATLDLIESLRPSVVIPGHGPAFLGSDVALARARSRLAAYRANPARHAAHAAKVLLKFKLLEVQSQPLDDFLDWSEKTPYFTIVRDRFFPDQDVRNWAAALVEQLIKAAAARVEGDLIQNA